MLRTLSLFAGIGGFDIGLERTGGFRTVAFCEISPFCRRVLARHWPEVPCYDDVRTLSGARLAADGITVDAICGGFPCQNVSVASHVHGINTGLDGDRSGLWYDYARLIDEIRPQIVQIENVDRLAGRGLDRVLGSLAAIGYDAQWDTVWASDVGAPQSRKRLWLVAYPAGVRMEGLFESVRAGTARQRGQSGPPYLQQVADAPFEPGNSHAQPLLRRVDGRLPDWMDRIKSLGNAVDPRIPEMIGRAILERLAA